MTVATGGKPQVEEILTRGVMLRQIPDPGDAGAIDVTHPGFCEISTLTAETRTLGDPSFRGQEIDIVLVKDQGDLTITAASPINQGGNNTMVFADIGDHLRLIGFYNATDGWEWRVIVNDGITLSTV